MRGSKRRALMCSFQSGRGTSGLAGYVRGATQAGSRRQQARTLETGTPPPSSTTISDVSSTPSSTRDDAGATVYRYRFGSAEFDEARGELRVAGLTVELEPRPLQVLLTLLRHSDELVTREELFDAVWGDRPTVDNVLPNAIA